MPDNKSGTVGEGSTIMDAALEAVADLPDVILLSPERADAPLMHHRAVTDKPGKMIPADDAVAHVAPGDAAESAEVRACLC